MSTDVLRRALSRHLESLRALESRGSAPLTCVFAWIEGEPPATYQPRFSPLPCHDGWTAEALLTDAVFHHTNSPTETYKFASHWGAAGSHVTLLAPQEQATDRLEKWARGVRAWEQPTEPDAPVQDALRSAQQVCERLGELVGTFPTALAQRLGFVRAHYPSDWIEVLFHLGWHFPGYGIDARRCRILSATPEAPWDSWCPEFELQLGGVRESPDVFPGVIISRLAETSDFLNASIRAIELVTEALDGIERAARPGPSTEFDRLRASFLEASQAVASFPQELGVRVLRFADSFRTPPATQWAGIERGGDGWGIPRHYVLSRLNANRVVCELRGPALEQFHELANRAGALLPRWPERPYPALLSNVGAFARYCDPDQYPWAVHAGETWNEGMVTDHRGNVERWLGLMFGSLMAHRLAHLGFTTRPEDATREIGGQPVNAVLTLRGLDPFAASARAIELAGLCTRSAPGADSVTGETANPAVPLTPLPNAPPIDQTEWSVLTTLRDKHPLLMKNVDVEVAANLSKQKVGEVVTALIDKGLANRPQGERKGAALTAEGVALVDCIRKSSAHHP